MAMVVGGQEAKSKVEGKRASHVSRERRGRTCVQRACACVRERDSQSGEVQGERLQWAGRLLRWHCLMSTYTSVSVSWRGVWRAWWRDRRCMREFRHGRPERAGVVGR